MHVEHQQRAPTVEQRIHSTTSCEVDEDLSLCLDSRPATLWTGYHRYCGANTINTHLSAHKVSN